jgi:hypothetical protein
MTTTSLGRGTALAVSDESLAPFAPILERLRDDAAACFGVSGLDLVPVRIERREHASLLRVAVHRHGEAQPVTHLFAKIFSVKPLLTVEEMRARIAHDFETTHRIHAAMSAWSDLGAVRAVACYPDLLALVTEEARGDTLGAYVRARAGWFPSPATLGHAAEVLATVGRWVRVFQGIDESAGRIAVDDLREYIDIRLRRLTAAAGAGFSEADRARVLRHIDAIGARVATADLTEAVVHADLGPGNVLVAGPRVIVLDFAMAKRGSVWQDISRLYVHLGLFESKPQFRRRTIDVLQRALLRGFDPDLQPDRPLFRLLLLRHHVNHLATMAARREPFPASLYNSHVRRMHRRWIDRDVASTAAPGRVSPTAAPAGGRT